MAGRVKGTGAAALASAGAASFGLWHRLFRHPLPKTRGSIAVKGLESQVTISRDRFGVPRIEARTTNDLCFGHGFCVGQDRLWQLEFYRRVASGRIAEFAGRDGLKPDRVMRTLGLKRIADAEVATIPAAGRTYLEAYAAGVNAAIAAAPAPAFELRLLRIDPEPWTAADSLAIGKVVALGFSTNMETELFRAELVSLIGAEKVARLEPQYPGGNPVVTQPGAPWPGGGLELAAQIAEVRAAVGLSLERAGSNNWVVSGDRSVTGMPLLANDPHISATIPDVWYAVELSTPDLEMRGGSLPGTPGLVIGQSRHVAWGFTNVMADVQDLYVERVRTAHEDEPAAYEFEGEWRPLKVTHERIGVRGRHPEPLEIWETHHGPIVNRALAASTPEPLSLAWTALREPWPSAAGVELGRATTGRELVAGLKDFAVPCMNLVWADSSGSIGYKLIGRLPVRRGGCPDLPKPGWSGEYEWDGYVPFDALPEIVDPPGGTIVTANNRIAPDDYPHHITSEYLDGYRAARIEELLAERERHSLDDFERIQSDLLSIPGRETAARLARLTTDHQASIRAIERLRSWDHRMEPDSVAATIYAAFTVHFARAVADAVIGDAAGAQHWISRSRIGFTEMTSSPWRFQARLLELWDEGDEELIGGRSWEGLALEALEAGLAELGERFGHDAGGWRWGRVHGLKFVHPMGEGQSGASKLLDLVLSRRVPAGGSQETVNCVGYVAHGGDYTGKWAASFRLLADIEAPERSRWQHMTGQSGHPGSPHYDDLMEDWLECRSNPVAQPAVARLRLTPA
ncbi:MAG: penicillin amidase [Thermoleophilaceae bacterium]|nr:penicillin amidase [Thermoleophilaceae bacterium]